MRHRSGAKRQQAGFTLIELLVVVLIIGILASIAIPQYFKVVERSRLAEAQTMSSQIRQAEERYLVRQGVYALTTTDLANLDISFAVTSSASFGMKNYLLSMSNCTGASGDTEYVLAFQRCTGPSTPSGCSAFAAGVSSRYGGGSGYTMSYSRCSDAYDFGACGANCDNDFAQ